MLIVQVERKRGDSKYVKAGIRRSSGGSIRLCQAEIQEHVTLEAHAEPRPLEKLPLFLCMTLECS